MKKIVVMPVKNEDWILEKTLSAISLWADHIIIADNNSTDETIEICKKYSKVNVIKNEAVYHNSNVRKELLDAARNFDGYNFIMSLDADEIPTTHILNGNFWDKISSLKPGDSINLQWVMLWRSIYNYRDDNSVWSNNWKVFGFLDNRKFEFDTLNVINDHTSRVPSSALTYINKFETPKILHFQFANWDRMLSKHRHYRVVELIQRGNYAKTIYDINRLYYDSKNESELQLVNTPEEWFQLYIDNGIDLNQINLSDAIHWYDIEVINHFQNYGLKKFKWLDIWDVDWEAIRKLTKSNNIKPKKKFIDPRNFIIKKYHKNQLYFVKKRRRLEKILFYLSKVQKKYR